MIVMTAGLVLGVRSDAEARTEGSYWRGLCYYVYTLEDDFGVMCKSCLYDFSFKNGKIWNTTCVTQNYN